MGAACCKAETSSKDPSDCTIDEVEMKVLAVPEIDDVFTAASDPINSLINLNNNVVGSVEALKAIAAVLLGAYYVKVDENYVVELWQPGEEEDKALTAAELAEIFKTQVPLKAALDAAVAAGAAVKAASAEVSGFEITIGKNDRLKGKRPAAGEGVDEAKVGAAAVAVASYNNSLFKLKKLAMEASLKEALDFKRAAVEILTNLRKRAKTLKPKAVVDAGAIARVLAGEKVDPADVIKLDAGAEVYDALPAKYQKAYDAVFGEEGIVACVQGAIDELTSVKEKVDAAQAAIDGIPKEMDAIKGMCEAAGLTPMQIMKVPGAVASNGKAFAQAPMIMQTVADTMTMIVNEVAAAVTAANDAAGSA
ncbi:unnamed protein product [Phaeothamnion confervicola]